MEVAVVVTQDCAIGDGVGGGGDTRLCYWRKLVMCTAMAVNDVADFHRL